MPHVMCISAVLFLLEAGGSHMPLNMAQGKRDRTRWMRVTILQIDIATSSTSQRPICSQQDLANNVAWALCRGGHRSCLYFEAGECRGRATETARLAGGWRAEPKVWALELQSTGPYFSNSAKCLLLKITIILLTSGCSSR